MIKKITTEYLNKINACKKGIEHVSHYKNKETIAVLKYLIKDDKLDWASWLICRVFNKKQKISYAIFAAEQVIGIYEKEYPDDNRPRNAIEAAKEYLKNPTKKNAYAANAAANAATYAADAAANNAYYAADAARAASATAADAATYAAANANDAAVYDAANANNVVDATADAVAKKKLQLKILKYGINLLV